jgi:transposase
MAHNAQRESGMARRRRIRYSPEFKAEAVRIVHTTETPLKVVARNLGVTVTTLRDWVHAGRPEPAAPLIEDERRELQRLRRENQQLRMWCCDSGSGSKPPRRVTPMAARGCLAVCRRGMRWGAIGSSA